LAQGLVLNKVEAVYPPQAKADKVQGSVALQVVVGKDGSIQYIHLINGTSPLLVQAAMDAVKQWKCRAWMLNGNPVEMETQVTIDFTLAGQ
jgi:protein TonB